MNERKRKYFSAAHFLSQLKKYIKKKLEREIDILDRKTDKSRENETH